PAEVLCVSGTSRGRLSRSGAGGRGGAGVADLSRAGGGTNTLRSGYDRGVDGNSLNLRDCRLGIIGLGYVGLPLAVECGKQFQTVGFDLNARRVAELTAGRDRTLEVSRSELKSAAHLTCTTDPAQLKRCRVFIITVPTPIDEYKRPDLSPLSRASE